MKTIEFYQQELKARGYQSDPAQLRAVERLQKCEDEWIAYKEIRSNNLKKKLFKPTLPRGLYLWGGVGRGKSFLMDCFYAASPLEKKIRIHFHEFMREVHRELHELSGLSDPLDELSKRIAKRYRLICFDEFHINDIADAMILGRLFTALFELGVVVDATSNVVPERLYENGLNRALFVPFIHLLEERMEVIELVSRTDFRLEKLSHEPVYHVPNDEKAKRALDRAFKPLTGVERGRPGVVEVLGRKVNVPERASGVARFRFADLCELPLGATDYLELAREFHTLMIDDIPVMDESKRNEAKRFINLIDALYDRHVKLLASAAAEPNGLYTAKSGHEAFQFDRTVSRLIEMRSTEYLALPHGASTSEASGNASGLVET